MHLSLTLIIPHLWPASLLAQEAACPDPDDPSRAEQPELERSYSSVSRPLPGLLHTSLVYNRAFSIMSHVPVATVGSLYERDERWLLGSESCFFVELLIGSQS